MALRRRALLDEQRPRLLGLVYRLLGSMVEAQLVLETVARDDSSADLTTQVTRAAMRRLADDGPRRKGYAGRWLPEPVPDSSLSLPMLLALEQLSPLERCAYVLRVVEGLSYGDVATALGRSGPATRQLVRRARTHLSDDVRSSPDLDAVRRFALACRSGRVAPLVGSLTDDVTVVTDLPSPHAVGRAQVAASLLATLRRLPRGTVLAEEPVNGEPGVVGRAGGRPVCALAVQSEGGRARVVLVVTNPARLAGLAPPARDRAPTRRMP